MLLVSTPQLKDLLKRAAVCDSKDSTGFRECVEALEVNWQVIKDAKRVLRDAGQECFLQQACQESRLVLQTPVVREVNPEFRKQLDELKRRQDQSEYNGLVADVTRARTKAEAGSGFLPTFRLQMGMGIQVVVTMVLGYLLGYAAGTAFESYHPNLRYFGGVIGMILAMMLEMFLFIARSAMADSADLGKKYLHLVDPDKFAKLAEGTTPDLTLTFQTAPRTAQIANSKQKALKKPESKKKV